MMSDRTALERNTESQDWQTVTLGSIAEVITKGTTPTTYGYAYESDGVNFVKVESIGDDGNFIPSKFSKISYEAHEKLSRSQIHAGDVLVSIAGALGRSAIADEAILPANTNQAVSIVRLNQTVDSKYVYFAIKSPIVREQIEQVSTVGAQPNLSLKQVGDFVIPLPPLREQRKIAAILTSVDDEIAATQRIMDATERVKRGLMQQLLTRGIGHTAFKQTEIGEIPAEWDIYSLKELLTMGPQNGLYKHSSFYGQGTPIVVLDDLYKHGLRINKPLTNSVELSTKEADTYRLREGDLLINRVSKQVEGVAKAVLVERLFEDSIFESNMIRVRLDSNRIKPEFFMWITDSTLYRKQVKSIAKVSSQTSVSQDGLNRILCVVPPVKEQQRISSILSSLNDKSETDKSYLFHLQNVKQSLLQVLLTGQVRVNVDSPSEVPV